MDFTGKQVTCCDSRGQRRILREFYTRVEVTSHSSPNRQREFIRGRPLFMDEDGGIYESDDGISYQHQRTLEVITAVQS